MANVINARINQVYLGRTVENVPYIMFALTYFNESGQVVNNNTRPIILFDPSLETLQNSSAAAAIVTILDIFDAEEWKQIEGQVARIEIDGDQITKIINAISDKHLIIANTNTASKETITEEVETVDAEIVSEG